MAARTLAAARAAGLDVTVWFAPSDAGPEMRHWLGADRDVRPQASGDRGVRLAAAMRAADSRRGWLAIVGDCPSLDAPALREAAAIAERSEVVIGPTLDGGYYLIGGMPPLPDVLTAMPWGTSGLLPETRARLTRVGAVWSELTPLTSVETIDDARAEGLLT